MKKGHREDRKPSPTTPKRVKDTVVSGTRPPKAHSVHFNVPEDLWRRFQAKLLNLGYSTASEYLRQSLRDALSSIDRDEKQ